MLYRLRINIEGKYFRLESDPIKLFRERRKQVLNEQDHVLYFLISEDGNPILPSDLDTKEGYFMRGYTNFLTDMYQYINIFCGDKLKEGLCDYAQFFDYWELIEGNEVIFTSSQCEEFAAKINQGEDSPDDDEKKTN